LPFSIDGLIEYARTQVISDFGTLTSIEGRHVLAPSFYLFLELGRYTALSARRDVLSPEGGLTAARGQEPILIYDPINHFSRRLSLTIPQLELEAFLQQHDDFPKSGADVLIVTSVRKSVSDQNCQHLIYLPGITTLGYLTPKNVTAVSRVGLAYLCPTSPETMVQQRFMYPS